MRVNAANVDGCDTKLCEPWKHSSVRQDSEQWTMPVGKPRALSGSLCHVSTQHQQREMRPDPYSKFALLAPHPPFSYFFFCLYQYWSHEDTVVRPRMEKKKKNCEKREAVMVCIFSFIITRKRHPLTVKWFNQARNKASIHAQAAALSASL